jgi:hypothetical protein
MHWVTTGGEHFTHSLKFDQRTLGGPSLNRADARVAQSAGVAKGLAVWGGIAYAICYDTRITNEFKLLTMEPHLVFLCETQPLQPLTETFALLCHSSTTPILLFRQFGTNAKPTDMLPKAWHCTVASPPIDTVNISRRPRYW